MGFSFDPMIKEYRKLYQENGLSPSSLGCPKGRQELRFNNAMKYLNKSKSLIDFGCGFGDFYQFLSFNGYDIDYYGVDIVSDFINEAKKKHKKAYFKLIKPLEEINLRVESVCCLGVFNYLYSENEKEHFDLIKILIKQLWNCIDKNLVIDFQSSFIEFKQPSAYHQELGKLTEFLNKEISKRFIIDYSYMPYEFMISIYKDLDLKNSSTFLNDLNL